MTTIYYNGYREGAAQAHIDDDSFGGLRNIVQDIDNATQILV
jgi:hypothetical protein